MTQPMSAELIALWNQGLEDLKSLRNKKLLQIVPALVLAIIIAGSIGTHFAIPLILLIAVSVGLLGQGLEPAVRYWVSEDQSSAGFVLRHGLNYRKMFSKSIFEPIELVKDGCFGLCLGGLLLILSPVSVLAHGLILFPEALTKAIWLSEFRDLNARIHSSASAFKTEHVKGTNIIPSFPLSGNSPHADSPEKTVSPTANGTIAILGGKVELLSSGGFVLDGGMAFDENTTFENLSIGDMILTRADAALLRVSYEGKSQAYYFNGSSWAEV